MAGILARLRRRDGAAAGEPADSAAGTSEAAPSSNAAAGSSAVPRTRFGAWLGRPMTSFHLIIAVTALLTTLGLIMVLSASGVYSYDFDGSPWAVFGRQVMWTGVGLIAFYIALRMPVRTLRRIAFPGFAFTILLLILVLIPGIGKVANGSRGWFVVAGFSMQPSELAKIAFAIWGAHLLAARRMERASLREMLIPLVPAAVIALARPRADRLAEHHPARSAVVRRSAAAGVPVLAAGGGRGGRGAGSLGRLPVRPGAVLARPGRRRPGHRLSVPPGPVRPGQRRYLR